MVYDFHMNAFHVYWSKPRSRSNPMHDFEVKVLALSALAFERSQGVKAHLVVDAPLAERLAALGVLHLWKTIDTKMLDGFEKEIGFDCSPYPNSAKLFVMSQLPSPYLLIDADAILYEQLPVHRMTADIICAHLETDPGFQFYPKAEAVTFQQKKSFAELARINSAPIFNVSLLWVNHLTFGKTLATEFFQIIGNESHEGPAPVQLMTFAEQRMAGHLAKELHLTYATFRNVEWACAEKKFLGNENAPELISGYHHLWHQKAFLRKFPSFQAEYFGSLLVELERRLPGIGAEAIPLLKNIECI